jgi:hypothetical protein
LAASNVRAVTASIGAYSGHRFGEHIFVPWSRSRASGPQRHLNTRQRLDLLAEVCDAVTPRYWTSG